MDHKPTPTKTSFGAWIAECTCGWDAMGSLINTRREAVALVVRHAEYTEAWETEGQAGIDRIEARIQAEIHGTVA